jgi:Mg2+/Co2+ transporter CorB
MVLESLVLPLSAVLGLVALSAFFSSSEIAVFSLPEGSIGIGADETRDDPRFATLHELRRDPHRLLVTILVGNNVVNVAIASITTVLATEYLPPGSAVTAATLLASFLILVFGEIVPKAYGLGHAEAWAVTVARPIRVVELVLLPLVIVFDLLTRRLNAAIGGDSGIEQPYADE